MNASELAKPLTTGSGRRFVSRALKFGGLLRSNSVSTAGSAAISDGARLPLCIGILVAVLLLSGCDLCIYGGSPDPTPTEEVVAIEVIPGADSLATVASDFRMEEGFHVWQLEPLLRSHEAVVSPGGGTVIFGDKVYRSDSIRPLADSLTACTFMESSGGLICAATVEDVVSVSGDTLRLTAARTYLLSMASMEDSPSILSRNSAEFISDERYTVTTYDRPASAGEEVTVVRSRETRQIVRDSSGAVVNDILFASELDVVKFALSGSMEIVETEFFAPAGGKRWISLSADGERLALEQDGVVWVDGETFEGKYPQFAGEDVAVLDDPAAGGDGGIRLRDAETGIVRRIVEGPVTFFTTRGDQIFYVVSGSIRRYDVSDGADVLIFSFADYEAYRTASQNIWISTQLHAVSALPNGSLLVFATTRWSRHTDDEC